MGKINTIKEISQKIADNGTAKDYRHVPIGADSGNIDRPDGSTVEEALVSLNEKIEAKSNIAYGICSTEAATAEKTVTIPDFILKTGTEITVLFSAANTASSPTLNVNNTAAKAIQHKGESLPSDALAENCTYKFVYDGTYWQLIGGASSVSSDTSTLEGHSASYFATAESVSANTEQMLSLIPDSYTKTESDEKYATVSSCTAAYATKTELSNALSQKASSSHNHDDRYYTEAEIDSKLNTINNTLNAKTPAANPTFTGTAKAAANSNYTTEQLRNVIITTTVPSSLSNGTICFVYEA